MTPGDLNLLIWLAGNVLIMVGIVLLSVGLTLLLF